MEPWRRGRPLEGEPSERTSGETTPGEVRRWFNASMNGSGSGCGQRLFHGLCAGHGSATVAGFRENTWNGHGGEPSKKDHRERAGGVFGAGLWGLIFAQKDVPKDIGDIGDINMLRTSKETS